MNTVGWIGLGTAVIAAAILLKKNASAASRSYQVILVPDGPVDLGAMYDRIMSKAGVQSVQPLTGGSFKVRLKETGEMFIGQGSRVWKDIPMKASQVDWG